MTMQSSSAASSTRYAIGLDIGGTKIAGGVVDASGHILQHVHIPTPHDGGTDATLAALTGLIEQLRIKHPHVEAIGVGAAGMVEWPTGYIRFAPNNAYQELPLQDLLLQETGLPTVVENDANAAAWAEACFGHGAGRRDLVVLTVGTGIGGGVILDGRLYRGHTGIASEVGHIILNPEGGHRCGCGATGCLEAEASGSALGRMGREAAAANPSGPLATLAASPDQVTGETVHHAAQQGDPTARHLFDQLGYWLGVGIASLVNLYDPEAVVIGGGLGATGDYLFAPTQSNYERFALASAQRKLPPLLSAKLGTEAGLVGAAALALAPNP